MEYISHTTNEELKIAFTSTRKLISDDVKFETGALLRNPALGSHIMMDKVSNRSGVEATPITRANTTVDAPAKKTATKNRFETWLK